MLLRLLLSLVESHLIIMLLDVFFFLFLCSIFWVLDLCILCFFFLSENISGIISSYTSSIPLSLSLFFGDSNYYTYIRLKCATKSSLMLFKSFSIFLFRQLLLLCLQTQYYFKNIFVSVFVSTGSLSRHEAAWLCHGPCFGSMVS